MSLIFSRRGLHDKAITYTEEALKICPDNTELMIMKGHEMLCQGRYEESTQLFLEAITHDAGNVERSLFLVGVSMLENGHCEMSHYILRMLKDNPAIEPEVLYPYLCFCEWTLHSDNFRETLTEALTQCPGKTYEIFSLPPAQGESPEAMIERLKQVTMDK